ncbi:hypothetical protein [Peribacillus cavernae]|uniref:hypothetical protein n=1 Tax=Peribacillus cavernae TaxID=1674310 RepID=UPI00163C4070|nr:hypothetical protein [Peribacillus cavernae]MDQ0217498.1 hypothetical protein [Peribacillus cavernae]
MEILDSHPKSIKKAIRYIKQDASKEQLIEIKKLLDYAIKTRIRNLEVDNHEIIS